jgi:hypothetical protein
MFSCGYVINLAKFFILAVEDQIVARLSKGTGRADAEMHDFVHGAGCSAGGGYVT